MGICLGLQLLFASSEESPNAKGLSLLEGNVTKIPNDNGKLKIPHMGWNSLNIKNQTVFLRALKTTLTFILFIRIF